MIPAMGITRWLSLFLDRDVSGGCLCALAHIAGKIKIYA